MASKSSSVSRRGVLKAAGAAAVAGGTSALLGGSLAAQQGAPAVMTNTQAGRKFRAFVKIGKNVPTVQELTLRPLNEREVVVRTEAAQTCYSSVGQVLLPGIDIAQPTIIGHGGVGIVEAVGPQVTSVHVGDRVVIALHRSCGRCFNCLRMRSDKCMSAREKTEPTCDTADGMGLFSPTGAMSELTATNEEQTVPVFTELPAADLAMLTCVGGCGLGMAFTNCAVDVASDVVVFGAGPVGLSAVQGAKIKGASQIIVVEPIPYRRELARKLGATAVVDPNQYKERVADPRWGGQTAPVVLMDQYRDALVEHLRDMCKMKSNRVFAGGDRIGPDHIIEAVGGDYGGVKPSEVQGPDPTGVTVLQQCWELCSDIGTLATCSIGQPTNSKVQFPASQWADGAKHHWGGTGGGTNDRRDIPRFVKLMETGQLSMKALASKTYPLAQASEAYRVAMNRTVVATIVAPNA